MAAFGAKARERGRRARPTGRVVVSSRVRLARNVKGAKFPDWSGGEEICELGRRLGEACEKAGRDIGRPFAYIALGGACGSAAGDLLREHGVVSQALLDRPAGGGVAFDGETGPSPAECFSVMVNEEDHLRIQCIRDGYDLETAWAKVDEFDTALGRHVAYAFSPRHGYLTACPSNLGTGMRASVEVALPALLLLDEFDAVSRAVTGLRFNVRGQAGEGSAVSSGTVQISTGGTLGLSEAQAIRGLRRVVDEVVRQETLARRYIFKRRPEYFLDYFSRALSLLQGAYLIGAEEAGSCLSAVRLGIETGCVRGLSVAAVDKLAGGIGHFTLKAAMEGKASGGRRKAAPPSADGDQAGQDAEASQDAEADEIDAFRAETVSHEVRKAEIFDDLP